MKIEFISLNLKELKNSLNQKHYMINNLQIAPLTALHKLLSFNQTIKFNDKHHESLLQKTLQRSIKNINNSQCETFNLRIKNKLLSPKNTIDSSLRQSIGKISNIKILRKTQIQSKKNTNLKKLLITLKSPKQQSVKQIDHIYYKIQMKIKIKRNLIFKVIKVLQIRIKVLKIDIHLDFLQVLIKHSNCLDLSIKFEIKQNLIEVYQFRSWKWRRNAQQQLLMNESENQEKYFLKQKSIIPKENQTQ